MLVTRSSLILFKYWECSLTFGSIPKTTNEM
jgi:hypothetical protein